LNEAKLMPAPPTKAQLRRAMRKAMRDHVEGLDDAVRALHFHRPPSALLQSIAPEASIGLYHALPNEAPASAYARFFLESGHPIALPYFADRKTPMRFRQHTDPYGESDLEPGPFGALQPQASAIEIIPDVVFVPLLGFTERGGRLGQGGGHYDRWLGAHGNTLAIGLAWDAQRLDSLELEPHDAMLDLVVTPTRIYGPF